MKKVFLLHSPFIHPSRHCVLVGTSSLLPSMYICVYVFIYVCISNMYVCMYIYMYILLKKTCLSFFVDLYICILAKSGTCYLLTSLFLACSICLYVFLFFLPRPWGMLWLWTTLYCARIQETCIKTSITVGALGDDGVRKKVS
jgi:hypothetical protein